MYNLFVRADLRLLIQPKDNTKTLDRIHGLLGTSFVVLVLIIEYTDAYMSLKLIYAN